MSNEPGNRYNIQLINALVLYVGTQAIAHIHNKGSTPSMSTITHSAHMDIFQNLAVDLDTEGKEAYLCFLSNGTWVLGGLQLFCVVLGTLHLVIP